VGVIDLSQSIAIDRRLLPTTGRDRSASFAIDQIDLPVHRKDLSLSIVVELPRFRGQFIVLAFGFRLVPPPSILHLKRSLPR
jgi:hypothetical protein